MVAGERLLRDAGGPLVASDAAGLLGQHGDRGLLSQHAEHLERAEDVQELEPGEQHGAHLDRTGGGGHGGARAYFFCDTLALDAAARSAAKSGPLASSATIVTPAFTSSLNQMTPVPTILKLSFSGGLPTIDASVRTQ